MLLDQEIQVGWHEWLKQVLHDRDRGTIALAQIAKMGDCPQISVTAAAKIAKEALA